MELSCSYRVRVGFLLFPPTKQAHAVRLSGKHTLPVSVNVSINIYLSLRQPYDRWTTS